ncbi:MAG: hypothetical protein M1822_004505 [Bathelium mastoideum]|nr:MAG: hypothetical protein M1822_004505 [Bathelium mastoideum]
MENKLIDLLSQVRAIDWMANINPTIMKLTMQELHDTDHVVQALRDKSIGRDDLIYLADALEAERGLREITPDMLRNALVLFNSE